jgi:hypothetical protein
MVAYKKRTYFKKSTNALTNDDLAQAILKKKKALAKKAQTNNQ